MFKELLKSVKQSKKIKKGQLTPLRTFNFDKPNVKSIRQHLGLSQNQFSRLLRISLGTLRNWEQKRREPKGPAKVLLAIVAKHPEIFPEIAAL